MNFEYLTKDSFNFVQVLIFIQIKLLIQILILVTIKTDLLLFKKKLYGDIAQSQILRGTNIFFQERRKFSQGILSIPFIYILYMVSIILSLFCGLSLPVFFCKTFCMQSPRVFYISFQRMQKLYRGFMHVLSIFLLLYFQHLSFCVK